MGKFSLYANIAWSGIQWFHARGNVHKHKGYAIKSIFCFEKVLYKFIKVNLQSCRCVSVKACNLNLFLHRLNVLINMFANSLALLYQQTGKDLLLDKIDGKLSGFWFCLNKRHVCNCFCSTKNSLYTLYTQDLGWCLAE